jgi:HlyD family secretion protein
MKRGIAWFLVVAGAAGIVGAYLYAQTGGAQPRFRTAPAARGPLTAAVSATGNLNAVITVQVGSQVSGQIRELFADFNSQVERGQLIARIDPATFEAKVSQARADVETSEANVLNQRAQVERARADVENARAALAAAQAQTAKAQVVLLDARRDLARKTDLLDKGLIARSDQDSAQAAHDAAGAQLESSRAQEQALASAIRAAEAQLRVAEAQLKAAEATVRQRRAALQQAMVDLDYSSIRAPVDGVVISRNVDVGQTVAASLQAPTLFTIAQDLTKMQVDTNVDEAEIGRVRVGQEATFTVDAFPGESFAGRVTEIRKAAKTVQNVVTYNVVVSVDNPTLRLLPGMTASIRIIVDSRPDALRVPNAALRFRPPGEDAAGPAEQRARAAPPGPGPPGGPQPLPPTPEEIRDRLTRALGLTEAQQKRLEPILLEARERFVALGRVPPAQRGAAAGRIREEARQKIRAILTPEQQAKYDQLPTGQAGRGGAGERAGRVWVVGENGKPLAVRLRLGITDGSSTEVLEGALRDGQEVIVGAAAAGGASARRAPGPPGVRF